MKNQIKLIKFYQGVAMTGGVITSYTPKELQSVANSKVEQFIEIQSNGVLIKSDKDLVLVPFNNVAYIQYSYEEPKLGANDSKLGLNKK